MTKQISITRDSIELVGDISGKGQDTLLLHAGGESRKVWHPVMARLSEHGFRSVSFDQRGHGKSGGSADDGVLAYGEDAKAMIRLLERPVVVGGSLGGFALMLALESVQTDVAGLVLVDVVPAPDPSLTRTYLSPRKSLRASPLVEDILSRSDQLSQIVATLDLPVLLICGGVDSPIEEEAREALSAIVPQLSIRVIEEAGHLVARDAPIQLSEHLIAFMNQPEVLTRRI